MEEHLMLIETVALVTGLTVIAIETVIIFMLKNHIKALNDHFSQTDALIQKFEDQIYTHLDHLNNHSHQIEGMLKTICDHDAGLHESGRERPRVSLRKKTVIVPDISDQPAVTRK